MYTSANCYSIHLLCRRSSRLCRAFCSSLASSAALATRRSVCSVPASYSILYLPPMIRTARFPSHSILTPSSSRETRFLIIAFRIVVTYNEAATPYLDKNGSPPHNFFPSKVHIHSVGCFVTKLATYSLHRPIPFPSSSTLGSSSPINCILRAFNRASCENGINLAAHETPPPTQIKPTHSNRYRFSSDPTCCSASRR